MKGTPYLSLAAVLVPLLAYSPATQAAGPAIANGSFESVPSGVTSSYGGSALTIGNASPTGTGSGNSNLPYWNLAWQTGQSYGWGCEVVNGNTAAGLSNCGYGAVNTTGILAVPNGNNYFLAESDGNYSPVLSQTITGLTAGTTYSISFWQAAIEDASVAITSASPIDWVVSFGGATVASNTTKTSQGMTFLAGGDQAWQQQTLTFTVASGVVSSVLTFMAQGGAAAGPPAALLDNITITQVPEPASVSILALGVLGAIWRRARTRA